MSPKLPQKKSRAGKTWLHACLTVKAAKVTHTALKVFFDDLGHEERDVQAVILEVLSKLPSEHDVRAIDLGRELAKRRGEAHPPPAPA